MPFMPNPHKWHFYLHKLLLCTHYSVLGPCFLVTQKSISQNKKMQFFEIFICIIDYFVVPLQPQTCAGDVCTSSAEGSRHIKRRLLALCSDL